MSLRDWTLKIGYFLFFAVSFIIIWDLAWANIISPTPTTNNLYLTTSYWIAVAIWGLFLAGLTILLLEHKHLHRDYFFAFTCFIIGFLIPLSILFPFSGHPLIAFVRWISLIIGGVLLVMLLRRHIEHKIWWRIFFWGFSIGMIPTLLLLFAAFVVGTGFD